MNIEKVSLDASSSMNVVFRVDASLLIGLGHIMRCVSLALGLRERLFNPIFICRETPGNMVSFLRSKNFVVRTFSGADDAEETLIIIRDIGPVHTLIVDHYELGKSWEERVRSEVDQLIVLDDLANRSHVCDVLIDPSLGRVVSDYRSLVPTSSQLLLGSAYALLSEQYAERRFSALNRRNNTKKTERVLVTMGGSDPNNATCIILQGLERVEPRLLVDVVMGVNYKHRSSLEEIIAQSHHSISAHVGVSNLSDLIYHADLAIGAGGVTAYERCCMGLPSILLMIADNQYQNVHALHQEKAAIFLGSPSASSADKIAKTVMNLIQNQEQWKLISSAAANVCDGMGVSRVIEALIH